MELYRDRAALGCGGSVCEMVGFCRAVGAAKSVVNWRRSLAAELCNFFILFVLLLFYNDSLGHA